VALLAAVPALITLAAPAVSQAQPSPIRHIVVIDLENHSFDNLLGFWCDDNPGRCPDGGMPATVKLSNGATVTPSVATDTVVDVSHTVASELAAMDIVNGVPRMDGWQNISGPGGSCGASTGYQCITGYEPSQIPNITNLATQFAISDRMFSMEASPSWGGHLYLALAKLDGFEGNNPYPAKGVTPGLGWGCDSDLVTQWVSPARTVENEPSCIPDYSLSPVQYPYGGAFRKTPVPHRPSIFDELGKANLPWKIYGEATPVSTEKQDGGYVWSICPTLADCEYTKQRSKLVDNSQFFTDAAAGNLPAFSIVTGGGSNDAVLKSCHNSLSMTACDNYIGQLVQAVESSPDWSSTAVFITFDDCGCFYDQVPPGTNPDGTQQGPRVPLIIVSPYAKAGYTDTTATTFAGILAFTEQTFGLPALGVNDAQAYPFTNAFNFSQHPLKPVKMMRLPLPPGAPKRVPPGLLNDPS
jgi:phospholipase C